MPSANPPNVLFVFSDQQRWDTCGCYGQRLDVTPNLDRMAAEGVRFENAFTCQPVCGPARACIQTGKYATELGCFTNHRRLPPDEKTLAHWLKEAGYVVGYVGKWHLASCGPRGGADDFRQRAVPPDRRGGYDDYWVASDVLEYTSHSYDGHMFDGDMQRVEFPSGRYRADAVTDFAMDFVTARGRARRGGDDRPFFLFVSYIEPHHQNDHDRYEGPRGSTERFGGYDVPGDLVDTRGDWRENYPDYLGCCHAVDANLGRLRQALEELGLGDNTLVVYTSDHGSHFRTRNAEYKRSCHDACIRIPLVACGPGFGGGRVVRELVSLIDVPPTLLTAGGVSPPPTHRGRALQALPAGRRGDWPEEVFLQISESHVGRAVRTARWKYAVCAPDRDGRQDPGSDTYVEDHLYDLSADPHERNNLVGDDACRRVRAELAETLKRRMAEAGEPVPQIRPAR
jgi:uncharacterized sulfatase